MSSIHTGNMDETRNNRHNTNKVENAFAEYMWMGDMDAFDRKVAEEFEEEEFIRSCIEQLLEEEEERETVYFNSYLNGGISYNNRPGQVNGSTNQGTDNGFVQSQHRMNGSPSTWNNSLPQQQRTALPSNDVNRNHKSTSKSTLNPNAEVFVPRSFAKVDPYPNSS